MDEKIAQDYLYKVNVIDSGDIDIHQKTKALHHLLDEYIDLLLQDEKIHFTTLFTKVTYLVLKFKLDKTLSFFLHTHRKNMTEEKMGEEIYDVARFSLSSLIVQTGELVGTDQHKNLFRKPDVDRPVRQGVSGYFSFLRVHVFNYNATSQTFTGFAETFEEKAVQIQMNVTGKNDDFNSLLKYIERTKNFPFILHLEHVDVSEDGLFIPGTVIFEPDYLVDITTVSECFKPEESNPLFYFLRKFLSVFQNKYLIIGNTANYFLDELFYRPESTYEELIRHTFKISPLGFAMMDDRELREVVTTLRTHFNTIKDVVKNRLSRHDITPDNSAIEPSFYAPQYGFQGRLDLFSNSEDDREARIVELKSGKPYKANAYGLNVNHYVQTLLYDLMVTAVHENKAKISNFILYSSQPSDPLRFAPPLKMQQKEGIKLRNQLVEIDYLLADFETNNEILFSFISSNAIRSDGFAKRDIEKFERIYKQASEMSRRYFNSYTAFVAREQILAKTGEYGMDRSSGLAGLWLDDMQEKTENFQLLNALEMDQIKNEFDYTIISFKRTVRTEPNANFRVGDLGVLYPYTHGNQSVLRNQIYKCSIIHIDRHRVEVRLRNKQQNTRPFEKDGFWHIEHDHLDHGFNAMFQDLFLFLSQDNSYQNKMLGLQPPIRNDSTVDIMPPLDGYLTPEQKQVLNNMAAAEEYYLLWGPPGTGKTSVILYEYLKWIFTHTEKRILVLAYTNRAVDEICEAISRIGNGIKDYYFRVGSRYSTDPKYKNDLLVTKLEEITNRYDLLELIKTSRIIVSTLSSINGKKELFSLINIDEIIVDEASQILEPQLIGFLSYVNKFILIGDHYQLPAIVRQREDESAVQDVKLKELGLIERRNSLFERLFQNSLRKNWHWCYGSLSSQGRMHQEIMHFVNQHFYHNTLTLIPGRMDLVDHEDLLFDERLIYLPVDIDTESIHYKTNRYEAEWIAKLISKYLKKDTVAADSIGVITPYRAQISAIKHAISIHGIEEDVNVDTVERYQGGARDIVILSLCLNSESQLRQLVNLSAEGIDRKLNVALTRARKQIIVLGNQDIMMANKLYGKLIESATLISRKKIAQQLS
ncbi:AAA domain-containing protein [Portibacter marinus]|uniref:AAA domain-containing protein n=1 Tax=Portibacter marinus TaxID=2898660 RepID=UPI001F46D144|nr:AAA domain-containing protein [Portibacter marinus]